MVCEVASCSSAQDIAAASTITESILQKLTAAIDNESFVSSLTTNLIQVMFAFSSQDVVSYLARCLAVWIVVEETIMEVTSRPHYPGTGVYYPDWIDNSGTCRQDGDEPLYMKLDPDTWLFNSLENCCNHYYSDWNQNKCMNPKGSGLWYVSHDRQRCATDCEEGNGRTCGGLAHPVSDDLFSSPRACCKSKLPWRFVEFCEPDSLLSSCKGTGLFYRGDAAGKKVCVRDCDPTDGDTTCGGYVEDSYVVLYSSAEDCCSTEYGWMENELCAARSIETLTDKYWPDKINSKCFKDSQNPATDLDVMLFNTIAECCKSSIWWVSEAACVATGDDETKGTSKFYVDFASERCAKDCEGPAPCAGLAMKWDDLYETESDCCDMIPWIDPKYCVFPGKTA